VVTTRSTNRNGPQPRTSSRPGAARRHGAAAPADAIALLKADHRSVEKLFREFERSSETAHKTRRKLVDKMIFELSVHAAIEEQFLYPTARREVPDVESDVLEAMEEHHVAKWLLSELERTDPTDERFGPKVTVLIENVRHHVREEEQDLFPELRRAVGRSELRELGARMAEAKRLAPTHPHPRLPDTPPGNLIAGAVSGAIDRARDKVSTRSRNT
jgi:hemerythrin-like domain-containing protein